MATFLITMGYIILAFVILFLVVLLRNKNTQLEFAEEEFQVMRKQRDDYITQTCELRKARNAPSDKPIVGYEVLALHPDHRFPRYRNLFKEHEVAKQIASTIDANLPDKCLISVKALVYQEN